MPLFAPNLLPCSFRGAPFAVVNDSVGGGRRIALHQYPGRDEPWAEDMGRDARRFAFRGFIVDGDVVFAGGPIQLQRAALLAAFEAKGSSLLIHPTLGALTVSVARFSIGQDLGAGQMSAVDVEFVEAGKQLFPSILAATGLLPSAVTLVANLAIDAVRAISIATAAGGTRKQLSSSAAAWSAQVTGLGADATSLSSLAAQLPGNFGRFANRGNSGVNGTTASSLTADTTVADLAALTAAARVAIASAASALGAAIADSSLANGGAVADAATALVAALASACADPADAIRLLLELIAWTPTRGTSAMGAAMSRLIRRAAAAALVAAVASYQPASADDAAAQITAVGGALDLLATDAADAGDDASYQALRAARGAVVQDLRRRGGTLARIRTFAPGAPLPALRLAQRYYRDASRADQLVTQARPFHPLFMPPRFQALAA